MSDTKPTHGGVIVFRETATGPEVLIITAKRRADEWVLPKGRIESGEMPEETAVRELVEETGIRAKIIAPVGGESFRAGNEKVVAAFFLARLTGECRAGENRELAWLSFDAARDRLSFEEPRKLLDRARSVLDRISPS